MSVVVAHSEDDHRSDRLHGPIEMIQRGALFNSPEEEMLFCKKNKLRYECHTSTLYKNPLLSGKFLRIGLDKHAKNFVTECFEQYRATCMNTIKHVLLKPTLSLFYSHTDLNGLLGVGQMSILSTDQLRVLFDKELRQGGGSLGRLLDVGAGCGRVTSLFAPLFTSVTATEVSPVMVKQLADRGFTAVQCSELTTESLGPEGFDVIALLNIIDRCDKPVQLLRAARGFLKSDQSYLLVATPLPLNPSVETAAGWVAPSESLVDPSVCVACKAPKCCLWEEAVMQLVNDFFTPNGFSVRSVSRLPYISQGDHTTPIYVLDDAVFVLYRTEEPIPEKFSL